jgi:hypothetical protein
MKRPPWWTLSFFLTMTLATLSIATGGFTVLRDLYFYTRGKEPPQRGLLTFLQVCSIMSAWGLWSRERYLRQQGSRPRLKLTRVYGQRPVWADNYGRAIPNTSFSSLVLEVENDPPTPSIDSVALMVTPRITVFDLNGVELFSFVGRWSDSNQPRLFPVGLVAPEASTIDIPIGVRRRLDLVIKYDQEAECFGFNNESYRFQLGRNPSWRLEPGDYLMRVRFRGSNVDREFNIRFRNPEAGRDLEAISWN